MVLLLAAVGGAAVFLITRKPPFDYGKLAPEIRELRAKLSGEPCHHGNALALSQRLLEAGDAQGVLAYVDGFLAKCGDWHRLRWVRFSAHKQRAEYQDALADATQLIADRPEDQDFYWWRAGIYEQMGRFDEAIADDRQSHALMPHANYIPFDLSSLLEKQGKPCEALAPVEVYLYHHPEHRDDGFARGREEHLSGLCPQFWGEGSAKVPYDREGRPRAKKVEIAGKQVSAAIDSGLYYVHLPRAIASQLGLPIAGLPLRDRGRAGVLVTVPSIAIGEAHARDVLALVTDGNDVVIGQTFLSRFDTGSSGTSLQLIPRENR
jgi:tetratricopeptide (TPR) repeat protein